MNTSPVLPLLHRGALLWALALAAPALASSHYFEFPNLNLSIPDGSSSGVSATRVLGLPPAPVKEVRVWLGIQGRNGSPAYNGDLYAALTHDSGYAVLLNRVGRRAGSGLGYGDNGFSVVFDDAAPNGDVHEYRLAETGSHSTPLGTWQPLDGVWAPDGRQVSPASALLSDPRHATLESFNGLDANGAWTLFVADWETGGLAKVDRWAVEITLVPEPALAGGFGALALAVWAGWRLRKRTDSIPVE